jgi:hypothetical protein
MLPGLGLGLLVVAAASEARAQAAVPALREIVDAHTGERWILTRDPSHPGGPGRLTPALSSTPAAVPGPIASRSTPTPPRPIVHGGDRLIVEENTRVAEARLEAVALGSAAPGALFEARLKIGGKVVRAVALGPGRAALAPEGEARP